MSWWPQSMPCCKAPTSEAIDVAFFIFDGRWFPWSCKRNRYPWCRDCSLFVNTKAAKKCWFWSYASVLVVQSYEIWVKKQWPSIHFLSLLWCPVGFDSLTGVAIILLGSQIGCLASTLNPFRQLSHLILQVSQCFVLLTVWSSDRIDRTLVHILCIVMQIRLKKTQPNLSPMQLVKKIWKHFNLDSGWRNPFTNEQETKTCLARLHLNIRYQWLLDLSIQRFGY